MQFHVYLPDDPQVHLDGLEAMCAGMRSFGIPPVYRKLSAPYQPCHILVTFGVAKKKTPRGRAIQELMQAHARHHLPLPKYGERPPVDAPHLVIERGFIRRDSYFMVGWNGLNGRAKYFNKQSPSDRWLALETPLRPWREKGSHVVLCGQVPWDSSVEHTNHRKWCNRTAIFLAERSIRPVLFRPHPLQKKAIDLQVPGVSLSTAATLQEDLEDAWAVVTFSSNAGVEASLSGVPAFVADPGAMGYGVLNDNLERINEPLLPKREPWLRDLAYTQWTLEEIAAGKAFDHLYVKQQNWLKRGQLWLRRVMQNRSLNRQESQNSSEDEAIRKAA